MKIQCSCGAKYAIDVTPGMPPIQFACQQCGQDYSAFINDLIRKELESQRPAPSIARAVPEASAPPAAPSAPPPPPPPGESRLKIRSAAPAPDAPAAPSSPPPPAATGGSGLKISKSAAPAASAGEAPVGTVCVKHSEPASERCYVCQKPICPKCMELFGYFCSAFCKGKADAHKLGAPVYSGQMFAKDADYWQKMGRILAACAAFIVLVVGVWIWYAWFASMPGVYFSVRFDDKSHSGNSYITNNQIVFLHGGTLARYDLGSKKPVWSKELVTKEMVADIIKRENEEDAKLREKWSPGEGGGFSMPPAMLEKETRLGLEEALSLHAAGHNVWVANGEQLTRYDWDSGNAAQTITLTNSFGEFADQGDEFVMLQTDEHGTPSVIHVSMATGEQRVEGIAGLSAKGTAPATPAVPTNALVAKNASGRPRAAGTQKDSGGGLPLTPYGDPNRPLDAKRVEEEAGNLTPGARIALPAIISGNLHQQRIFKELADPGAPDPVKGGKESVAVQEFALVPDTSGYLQFGSRLLEEKFVERNAMKAPPKKSTLDNGNLNVTQTADVANEILNDMQRNNGGGTVTEDVSRYQVAVRKPDAPDAAWSGEIVGEPRLFPLKTVNVVAGGKTLVVLDKSNKKLWQVELTFALGSGMEGGQYGDGPCIERDGTLYVFDQAMLSAFDLANGNARWRLPSVGIVGLFTDDKGMLYVNTTTASLDDIKYSQQIDINKSTQSVFMKIDPKTGKMLWSMHPRGLICYLSGKYIYTYYTFDPGDEEDQLSDATSGLMKPAMTAITRIDPKSGRVLWEHDEPRATVDVKFNGNIIQLVMKKEVEVLKYFTL